MLWAFLAVAIGSEARASYDSWSGNAGDGAASIVQEAHRDRRPAGSSYASRSPVALSVQAGLSASDHTDQRSTERPPVGDASHQPGENRSTVTMEDASVAAGLTGTAPSVDTPPIAVSPYQSSSPWSAVWLTLVIAMLLAGSFVIAVGQGAWGGEAQAAAWRDFGGWTSTTVRALWRGREQQDADAVSSSSLALLRADLHDGPAQHLAYALMYLNELEPRDAPEGDQRQVAYRKIGEALRAALDETRDIASGASLPAVRRLDPATVIADAIRSHETRTHTSVQQQISGLPAALTPSVKVCLYRFTQEGLNNAYRHARGKGQKLTVKLAGNEILAEVADEGPGTVASDARPNRLGLTGLRQRAEAAGGQLEVVSIPGKGTKLVLRLPAAKRMASE